MAIADHRTPGPHATLHLREPRTQLGGYARDVTTHAEDHQRRLRLLQDRIARVCRRPLDVAVADMRAGRILTAPEAHKYGLVDTITTDRSVRPLLET